MTRLRIDTGYDPVEVDLWGALYETVDISRSLQKKAEKLEAQADATPSPDEQIALVAELMDIKLKPVGHEEQPSKLIKAKWEKDNLTSRQLLRFVRSLGEAENPL